MPPCSRESDSASPGSSAPAPEPSYRDPGPFIAISATFTAEALEQTLLFWLPRLGFNLSVRFAPYNQVFQQLLDPGSLLAANRDGFNVVLVRFEDWARFRDAVNIADLEREVRHLESALRSAAATAGSPTLVCLCPASPDFLSDRERREFLERSENFLVSVLQDVRAIHVVTSAELAVVYPVSDYYDPHADQLGHVPYTPEFFAGLGTMIARKLNAARMRPYKVIVLDCDDTLWDGICGEDGPQGVRLDAPRKALQQYMLAQREAGMVLCLASKNNPEDVEETFRAHPEMPLRLEHFAATRLNWEPKSANLQSLAEELNLGLDSFILVDDSAAECAEVQAGLPEVLALALPADAGEWGAFLNHVWAFDHWSVTTEDRARASLYTQEAERARLARRSASFEEFLGSLKLEIRIVPMPDHELARVAQLTRRTSQMNFTTIRRSEVEISRLIGEQGFECLTVEVNDRFGSYGLTGVMLFRSDNRALYLDSFLLSCRALGRGVEHQMLAWIGRVARERGLTAVDVPFVPTARNRPAEALLSAIGAQFRESTQDGSNFRFPSDYLAEVRYTAGIHACAAEKHPGEGIALPAEARQVDYAQIANEFREPAQILRAAGRKERRPKALEPTDMPRTELERRLATMWANLLSVPAVGIRDNFFDLGGHSLLAVQLLSVVRQTFAVDLSLKVVYSGDFTVAELAKAIELREIEAAGADRYTEILRELEGLSEEQVRAALAEEQDGTGRGTP